jgi:Transport and Golgi organisation 2
MCTVSFLPSRRGFVLAMNRDERKSRVQGLPPRMGLAGSRRCLYPAEPDGGSWVGINDRGLTLALINWYEKPQRDRTLSVSRGVVIPRLLRADDIEMAGALLKELPLARINPFRLIAVWLPQAAIREWRWDGKALKALRPGWRRRHWFSSGLDEALANRKRMMVVRAEARSASAETPEWLRRLHRSHAPARSAYSICMHRDEAETVSYTEIAATSRQAKMTYAPGAPCAGKPKRQRRLPLRPSPAQPR